MRPARRKLPQQLEALGSELGDERVTPVVFPPGSVRLDTARCTGSPNREPTIGMVEVAAFTASGGRAGGDHHHRTFSAAASPGSRS